jgi:hypothetical protein
VAEAREDGLAAAHVALQVLVAERQQVRLDDGQVRVARSACREPPGGSHDDANADTPAQELLQKAAARASRAADEKDGHSDLTRAGLLARRRFPELDLVALGIEDPPEATELRLEVRRATGFWALKKIPPMPVTLCM